MSCGLNAWRRLRQLFNGIVNNALFHSPTYQSDAASNHSHPALLSCRFVAELYPRFCNQLDWGY